MINVIILPGIVYVFILVALLLLAISVVLIGLTLRKIVYYTQMNGLDIWNASQRAKDQAEEKSAFRYRVLNGKFNLLKGRFDQFSKNQHNLLERVVQTNELLVIVAKVVGLKFKE